MFLRSLLDAVSILLIALPLQAAFNWAVDANLKHETKVEELFSLRSENVSLKETITLHEGQNEQLAQALSEKSVALSEKAEALSELEVTISNIEQTLSLNGDELEFEERLNLAADKATLIANVLKHIPSLPPAKQRVSSSYGLRTHPITKRVRKHRGIDYLTNVGDPIYAPANGIVIDARPSNRGSGNFLKIQHVGGFTSSYSHLKSFLVKRGDVVEQGQKIALSGQTGMSTGPHLHYEVRWINQDLNPKPFTNVSVETYDDLKTQFPNIAWDYIESTLR